MKFALIVSSNNPKVDFDAFPLVGEQEKSVKWFNWDGNYHVLVYNGFTTDELSQAQFGYLENTDSILSYEFQEREC